MSLRTTIRTFLFYWSWFSVTSAWTDLLWDN